MSKANQAAVHLETFVVGDVPIVVKEWMGQRVVSCSDIDKIHKRKHGTTNRCFRYNMGKFEDQKDYFKLSTHEIRDLEPTGYNFPHGAYVFTKSGYLMLVKSLNDDKAWEIQRQLVNAYFVLEKMIADKANEAVDIPAVIEEKEVPAAVKKPRKKKEINSLPVPAVNNASDNSAVTELIDLFKQSIAYQNAQLEVERKRNDDFRALIEESFKLMNTVVESLVKQQKTPEAPVKSFRMISEYAAWRKEINELATKTYSDSVPGTFKDKNAVLSMAYKKLQSEYGVCWDQAKRDYYNANGCNHKDTMELEYFIEQSNPNCKNMLLAKLKTIYNETCAKSPERKTE